MATIQSSSPSHSPQEARKELHQHLAAKLADACVNPSYMPDLWAVYFHRFQEVLGDSCSFVGDIKQTNRIPVVLEDQARL
jgi:hypothetical protein